MKAVSNVLGSEVQASSVGQSVAPALVGANPYAIHLEFFSGPLDLLLHLVRQQEVAVEDVEMAGVAEHYLRIISQSPVIDLDSASEYLVIAATLLAIKSKMLLPHEGGEVNEAGNEELGEEFYEQLRERLKQYEITQRQAQSLSNISQLNVDVFVRKDRSEVPRAPTDIEPGQDSLTLAQSFFSLLKRIGASFKTIKIHLEPISIVSYMMKVVDKARLLTQGDTPTAFNRVSFSIYNDEVGSGSKRGKETRKTVIIGSFIAVLELAKRGMIEVVRDSLSRAFYLKAVVEPGENAEPLLEAIIESEWSGISQANAQSAQGQNKDDFVAVREEQLKDELIKHEIDDRQVTLPLIELEGNEKVVIMSRYRREKEKAEKLEAEQVAEAKQHQSANVSGEG